MLLDAWTSKLDWPAATVTSIGVGTEGIGVQWHCGTCPLNFSSCHASGLPCKDET